MVEYRRGAVEEASTSSFHLSMVLAMTPSQLPDNPRTRFRDVYAALNAERGWFEGPGALRFAAVAALCCAGTPREVASGIRKIALEIKEASGWFGTLSSELRFIVGALLLLDGDRAAPFLEEVRRVRSMFRAASLRRGGTYETLAILILRQQNGRRPITGTTIQRFGQIYEEMKRYHWWLTGPDDFPACAILTGRPDSPRAMGRGIEKIYQELRRAGFSRGDPLQTAANILFLADVPPRELASRYHKLAKLFEEGGVSIWQSDYDELAILSFLDHSPHEIVSRVLRYREDMKALSPRPDRSLTFNLAASIAFMDLVRLDGNMNAITGAKALMDMQAIIQAQQAACAAAASSAAVAASSSGGGS